MEDVDIAVKAARKAFETVWGLNCPGNRRGLLLWKLAELLQRDFEEIAAIEALNTGMEPLSGLITKFAEYIRQPTRKGKITNTRRNPESAIFCWVGRKDPR